MKRIIKSVIINLCLIFMFSSLFGQQKSDYIVQVTTSVTEIPAAISFSWKPILGDSTIFIYRKVKPSTDWGSSLATLPADATEYTDNSVEIGVEYEYQIRKGGDEMPIVTYVSAGIKCPEIVYRGKVILLVDSSFVDSLRSELVRFETDLVGDGWDVLRKDISRSASVKYVKSIIRDFYNSDTTNVKALILFGHIPVPYSGCFAGDSHADHFGSVPADLYYGDMNETIWTDDSANCATATRSKNRNVPGDGKFDVTIIPQDEKISLQIGRVDLYNLPAFLQSE